MIILHYINEEIESWSDGTIGLSGIEIEPGIVPHLVGPIPSHSPEERAHVKLI